MKNRAELKLHVGQGKVEYKHVFKYVQDYTSFVYQGTLLSELHNSCSCLEEHPLLAPLPKSGTIPYCQCFLKYIKNIVYKS